MTASVTHDHQNAANPATRPPLTRVVKLLYGMGAMGASAKGRLVGFLLLFYNQLVGLPATWVSAAIAVSIFVDAFWDPIVGQLSDSTRTRWGRRHPYIYGAAIPAAVFFVLLFMPPKGWSDPAVFFYMVAMLLGMRFFDSLGEIPASALLPELTQNYDERTNVQSYRFLFSTVIGGLFGLVLAFGVFLRATKTQPFGQFNQAGYAPFAVTVAIIGVIVVVISSLATQRYVPYMHRPPQRRAAPGELARIMGIALSNRNFVSLASSSLIFGIAVGLSGGLGLYFNTYMFELGSKALLLLGLCTLPAGLAGVFLAPLLSRIMDKKRACLTVFFIAIASTTIPLSGWLLGLMPAHKPWVLPVLIVDAMTTAALATTGFIIVSSMIADVVEETQLKTGRRSEGLLYAAESLVRKVTTSFAALVPGLLIAVVHFPKHARPGQVDPTILVHLALVYLPTYTVLTLCSTSALMFYRINRGHHEDNLKRLGDAEALIEAADASAETADGPGALIHPA
ncbi:MAG TPA: MFS transporter [Caulobacteraceae bacterium]|nr:MFS transporter [Caulobacteraceae bacterium]